MPLLIVVGLILSMMPMYAQANSSCIPTISITASGGGNQGEHNRFHPYGDVPTQYDESSDTEDSRFGVTLKIPLSSKLCDSYESRERAKIRYDQSLADKNDVSNLERMIRLCNANPNHPLLEGKCK